jgi:hypothetical protein
MKFPDLPKAGASVAQSFKQIIDYLRASRIVSINGVQGQESTNGTVFSIPLSAAGTDTINYQPFEVILFKSAEIWKIRMIPGYVIARKNTTGECVALLEPTSLPTTAAPMTVETGDKVWIKVSESVNGIATAALVESGESWPTSLAAVLLGGNLGGTAGYKYYRIASFVASGEAIGDSLVKTQVITGHIDHFQPTLADNLISSASTGEARVMKQWNASEGRWDFRFMQAGTGIDITEDGDSILFESSHPWKVKSNGDSTVTVTAGKVMGPFTAPSPSTGTPLYIGYVSCATQSVSIPSSGYLYAVATVQNVTIYEDAYDFGDGVTIDTYAFCPQSARVEFDADAPQDLASGVTGEIWYPIAQVTVTGDVAEVIDQILTHNPQTLEFSGGAS